LSALAVVLFHAGASWLPAGFLGVDIFFVVSGFLITSLLLSENERDDGVALGQFWLRRARRLLPVLGLVLIATTIYAALVLPSDPIPHLRETAAAAMYVTNWDLVLRDVSYWDLFERPSQLRHLWSLAVEEQFYIVWPVLFAGIAAISSSRRLRIILLSVVVILACLSATWMAMLYEPGQDASRVYFGSDARAFTILIGVALAVVWRPWRWTAGLLDWRSFNVAISLIGFGGAASLLWLMLSANASEVWLYPYGLIAMSICAALVVASVAWHKTYATRLLGSPPLRWLGERSYSVYLWHWPVMLALVWEFDFTNGSLGLILLGTALTLFLAELSFRIVETPMRRPGFWSFLRPRSWQPPILRCSTFAVLIVSLFVVCLIALVSLTESRTTGVETVAFTGGIGADQAAADDDSSADSGDAGHSQAGQAKAESKSEEPAPIIVAARPTNRSRPSSSVQTPATSASGSAVSDRTTSDSDNATDSTAATESGGTEEDGQDNRSPDETAQSGDRTFVYVVRAGDSPNFIAQQFGVTREAIIELNGERVMRIVHPGELIRLPCPGGQACALVEIEPARGACISWEQGGGEIETCQRALALIQPPARFRIGTSGPLSGGPEWTFGNETAQGEEFTLTADMLEPLIQPQAEATQLVLRGTNGLAPLAVGDSVMRGAAQALSEAGFEVDAVGARPARMSLSSIADHLESHGHDRTIVFQGIGYDLQTVDDFEEFMQLLKDVSHVVILTHQFPDIPPWRELESNLNDVLRSHAGDYDNITLIDWHAMSDGRQDELTYDGAHLTTRGVEIYVGAIVDVVSRIRDLERRHTVTQVAAATDERSTSPRTVETSASSDGPDSGEQPDDTPKSSAPKPAPTPTAKPDAEPPAKEATVATTEEPAQQIVETPDDEPAGAPTEQPAEEQRQHALSRTNSTDAVESGSADEWFRYVVRAGDVPYKIARLFGASLADLRRLNGEDYFDWILVGRHIRVPCPGLAPCRLIRVEPTGEGCIDWNTRTNAGSVCSESTILADFPVSFRQRDRSPLAGFPLWQWPGGERRAEQFTISELMGATSPRSEWAVVMEPDLPPLAIGDSVMYGARHTLQAAGVDVVAKVGIGFPEALRILTGDIARNGARDVVIFQSVGNHFDDEEAFLRLLDATGDVKHLIVMTRNLGFRPEILHIERRINEMLRHEAAKYQWVTLLDWREAVEGRQAELTFDGSHLKPSGARLYADLVLAAIKAGP
jgi:peptidoglycan/LPS O-acetylase OafA/YrhL/LysM repeat protein